VKTARELGLTLLPSLADYGMQRLESLCDALALPEAERSDGSALFRLVASAWPEQTLSAAAPWENDLTDDGTPFEFSVGFEREQPELRLLFESQLATNDPSCRTSWQAGMQLQRRLRASGSCDGAGFDRVASMFEPSSSFEARFSLWHAAVLRPGRRPMFKAYLNPEVRGVEASRELTRGALHALGVAPAWTFTESRLRDATRVPYLSVDLEEQKDARVKLYLTATDALSVEQLVRGSSNLEPGVATDWLNRLTLGSGPYWARPILVCHAYRPGSTAPEATVHVPIRNYAPNDAEALKRTLDLLPSSSGKRLVAALTALARQDLQGSRGVLSYVSLRLVEGRVRVTTYLAPGAYTLAEERRESGTIPTGRSSSRPPKP
jgi:Tryptophan dimethylallyltransferase